MILTEKQIQDMVQAMYEQDQDTPDSTSEDYLVRRSILNAGVGFWEIFNGTEWASLYTTLAENSTGGETTVATGDEQSDCPTALVRIGSYIKLTDGTNKAVYVRKTPQEAADLVAAGSKDKFFWISGKPNAYKINWNPEIPEEYNGWTISYPYYKKALQFSAATDIADASDHLFLVHYLLSWLYKNDDPGKSREQFDIANALIQQMKRTNDISILDYRDNEIGIGFGL
ncbi:MAG TPA: hypothetical protein P5098_01110 [Candidatus Dojkabacteria bacterium]|nr:hypothetical protein [Candidatus Dojkabacteria bacterium]